MKYVKLLALVLLAWAVVFAGTAVLSMRSASPAVASVTADLIERNALPGFMQPHTFTYTDGGKTFQGTGAALDKYLAQAHSTPIIERLSQAAGLDQGRPGAGLLYDWCVHILPWLSAALALWGLNILAGIKRLADAME